jgi:ClpP class serine protease
MTRRQSFRVGAAELIKARASALLAIDARVFAGGVSLPAEPPAPMTAGNVAILPIMGPLAQRASNDLCGYVDGYDAIAASFLAVCEDPSVSAIVLRIDSPGGDLAGLEEAIACMVRARSKPVLAYVDELAASAAYWLAACLATDGIYLPVAGQVGSIGVIAALVDETRALAQKGIGITLVRDPAGKAESHPASPLAPLAQRRMEQLVRQSSARFALAIERARGIDPRPLDGALLSGAAAVKAGLADGLASLEDVVATATGAAPMLGGARPRLRAKTKTTPRLAAKTKGIPMTRRRPRAYDDGAPLDKDDDVTCPECGHTFPPSEGGTAARARGRRAADDDADDPMLTCPACGHEFRRSESGDAPPDDDEEKARVAAIAARYGLSISAVRSADRDVRRATVPTVGQAIAAQRRGRR